MHKHKHKPKPHPWGPWSEWSWDENRRRWYRVRQDVHGSRPLRHSTARAHAAHRKSRVRLGQPADPARSRGAHRRLFKPLPRLLVRRPGYVRPACRRRPAPHHDASPCLLLCLRAQTNCGQTNPPLLIAQEYTVSSGSKDKSRSSKPKAKGKHPDDTARSPYGATAADAGAAFALYGESQCRSFPHPGALSRLTALLRQDGSGSYYGHSTIGSLPGETAHYPEGSYRLDPRASTSYSGNNSGYTGKRFPTGTHVGVIGRRPLCIC